MAYMKSDGYGMMNGLAMGGGGANSSSAMANYLKGQNPYSVNGMALAATSDMLHSNVAYGNEILAYGDVKQNTPLKHRPTVGDIDKAVLCCLDVGELGSDQGADGL
ncbi:hypothetical protein RvY_19341-2 [Ramazzottius varieornatus]|uniref:Uncharacterized protein n=1 Tax=Ramazzottius varieornatus TaxID=947166 RepID=A0A1D1W932_RAMVA|nr:hypothetical protein RvY_19341-2 [Ramazzottius varieornatus]